MTFSGLRKINLSIRPLNSSNEVYVLKILFFLHSFVLFAQTHKEVKKTQDLKFEELSAHQKTKAKVEKKKQTLFFVKKKDLNKPTSN